MLGAFLGVANPSHASDAPEAADRTLDIAPFGESVAPDSPATAVHIRWAEPRKVHRVVVEFEQAREPSDPSDLVVEYWRRSWNGCADPVLAERGVGFAGWDTVDDWTNGAWVGARTKVVQDGLRYSFSFDPIDSSEIAELREPGVRYRKTLQVRVRGRSPLPPTRKVEVFTASKLEQVNLRIEFGKPARPVTYDEGGESIHLEMHNGRVIDARSGGSLELLPGEGSKWKLAPGSGGNLGVTLEAAAPGGDESDMGILTVRSSRRPFSVAVPEVARGERILVDDLGVLVTRGDDPITLERYREALRTEFAGRTVHSRVAEEPEQTLQRAWGDMPLKRPLWFAHGLPGNRNAMRQHPNGEVEIASRPRWFQIQPSPNDTARKQWTGSHLRVSLGLPDESLRGGRRLEEGYLPLLRTWWQDGPVWYQSEAILDALDSDLDCIRLDDPTLLLVRIRMLNTSRSETAAARLRFGSASENEDGTHAPERLTVRDGRAMAEGAKLRFVVRGLEGGALQPAGNETRWEASLAPGESGTLLALIPSITVTSPEEVSGLSARDFDADAARVCAFWRNLTANATQITTPEPWLNDFYKAHLRHLLVNCLKELDSDRLHAHVGTFRYGVYPSESVMMISDLDRRGLRDMARRCLESFLHYQGSVSMPGNFASAEGQLYGAGGHETLGYNKSHGYVMRAMAEHWWITRDRAWMERAAPQLVKACDWVAAERKATMTPSANGTRPIQHGWLPSGSLEDVTDFWYWQATNTATAWGFLGLADALADFGHPESRRLQSEAQAYSKDVLDGLYEARVRCPVVRLRDGTSVPKFPSHQHLRGRAHGWLRETLEGSLFLPAYGLLAPHAPETSWILKDYEDNLYISGRYGYALPDFDRFWFSRGGFSMQSNLLDGPLPYLWRDEIKHFLRAFFNGFTAAFYPEVRMCNEHALPELGWPKGDHFKTSDEAQVTYWLRLMFVNDQQPPNLLLGQAIPRPWLVDGSAIGITKAPTRFGELSLHFVSRANTGSIKAVLDPPSRNAPDKILLRFRHPQQHPIQRVTLNGKPHARFDAEKEWVILPGNAEGPLEVEVFY